MPTTRARMVADVRTLATDSSCASVNAIKTVGTGNAASWSCETKVSAFARLHSTLDAAPTKTAQKTTLATLELALFLQNLPNPPKKTTRRYRLNRSPNLPRNRSPNRWPSKSPKNLPPQTNHPPKMPAPRMEQATLRSQRNQRSSAVAALVLPHPTKAPPPFGLPSSPCSCCSFA